MKRIVFAVVFAMALLAVGSCGYAQVARDARVEWPAVDSVTRPWTRWWWMGSAVDKKNLSLNLERYRAAGLGGMELTPIYGVRGYEDKFIDYLSPVWVEMLGHTLSEARRLGLGLDMSTGTGWPFGGGPLIDSSYACKEFFYKNWVVKGGGALADTVQYIQEPLLHVDGRLRPLVSELVQPVSANKDLQGLALDQVRFPGPLTLVTLMAYRGAATGISAGSREVLDLTDKVGRDGQLHWAAPAGGDWTLYGIFQGAHGKMVERAAPGAEGNVIDHFSSRSLHRYLSRFDTAFAGHSLQGLRSFFNDSYEVDDSRGQSNWTPGFFELFKQHRGYDLRPYLPALLGKDEKEVGERVLCDYRETISDLLLEQFTLPWKQWAHGQGKVIRNQAHGSPANILDLYVNSDIPETEGDDVLRFKFASSAAHITSGRLVSAEAVTWQNEHFLTNYSDVRRAADKYFLGGVNHLVYHGTAYSPEGDPWPGWLFYAAVHFTPNDPSWSHFHVLNEYITRCQSFLQKGRSDNDVLLYYPVYDSWTERGHDLLKHYDRMEPEFTGTGFKACADSMVRKGYTFDYISDRQLRETDTMTVEGAVGVRTIGWAGYQTVLLPDIRHISLEAFEKLVRLAEAGARVLVYQHMPTDVPGFAGWEERRGRLLSLLGRLSFVETEVGGVFRAVMGKGEFLMGDDLSQLLGFARIRRETMVDQGLDFVRRKYEDGELYFVVNRGEQRWEGSVALSGAFRSVAMFDPMTGERGKALLDKGRVWMQLEPGESRLLRTYDKDLVAGLYPYYKKAGAPVTVDGNWVERFIVGGPVLPAGAKGSLGSWVGLGEDGARFSGTAAYMVTFPRPAAGRKKVKYWLLDLGEVHETAEVHLNFHRLGTLIGPRFTVVVADSLMREKNVLQLHVSNGMTNRIIDMDKRGVVWKKFYNTNFPAHDRANRGADGYFDASKWEPRVSGLIGPVSLTGLERIEKIPDGTVAAGGKAAAVVKTAAAVKTGDVVKTADPEWVKLVGARVAPVAASGGKTYMANDYGAVGDGVSLATKGIQAAIDACTAKGGGVVRLAPGVYLTGSIFIKEGVELRLDKGVTLLGSQRFEDYPEINTRIAGIGMKWPAALLNMIDTRKAAITGEGTVNAQGKFCWDKYWAMRKDYDARGLRWIVDYDAKRVRTLLVQHSSDISVLGIRFENAGFWTVQIVYSDHVTVDGIVIRNNEDGHGPSTDGIDIDSSTWVLVEHCDIDCNDDDFCLKAGRDWDGLRVNRPTEYVVIRDCVARKGGGLLTIGSETSGSIRHVLAKDLVAKGTGNGFHIKSATTRGGTVEDIHIRNISMDSVGNAILFTMNWNPAYSYSSLPKGFDPDSVPEHWKTILHKVEPAERGTPHFRDIWVSGLTVGSARRAISATGLESSLISGVHIDHANIQAAVAGDLDYVKGWEFTDVRILGKDGKKLQTGHVEDLQLGDQ